MAPSVVILLALAAAPPPTGDVTLSLDEYNRLVEESKSHAPPPVDPPVEASVRQAAYSVSAQGHTARVKMNATVDVLQPRGVVQPLLSSSAALISLKVDGQLAGARVVGDRYAVPLPIGVHTVEMEVMVPVASEGPSELAIAVPQALSARLSAELPGNKLSVQIDGVTDMNVQRGTSQTLVTAALPVTESLSMSWVNQGAEEEEDPEEDISTAKEAATPGKARALVLHHVSVDETVLRGTVRATLTVQKGTRSQVALTLPKSVEVLDVQAADLREWIAPVDGDTKKILVTFKYGRTGEVPVTVRYERTLGEASEKRSVEVPEPIVLDVENERGFVGFETAPGVEVALQQHEGAEALDGRDLPGDLWSMSSTPLVLGVKYLEHPLKVGLTVSQRAKVAVADTTLDRADYETVVNSEGRAVSAVNYAVRNHQRQYLEVTLPRETEVLSCFVGGRAVRPARGASETLFIPLNRSTAAEGSGAAFPVELVIAQQVGKLWPVSSLDLTMPSTAVQAMDLSWRVYVPVTHTAISFGGNFSTASQPARMDRWFSVLLPSVGDALAGGGEWSNKAASLEGYDYSQGVKARFQRKEEDSNVASAVRVSRPLVGRMYDFRAQLLRSAAPHVTLTVLERDGLTGAGWLAVLLSLAGALLLAARRQGSTEIPSSIPVPLMIAGVLVGLLSGLYVDHVMTRVALALLAGPGALVVVHLVATHRLGVRMLGLPVAIPAFVALFLALVFAAAQSVVGTAFMLAAAYGGARLLRRFFLKPPPSTTAAPPTGTPVTGASTTTGGAA